jgi:Mlc titration factor MtfA (ptsG expression regulator)
MIALTNRAKRRRALQVPFPDEWRRLLGERLVHWRALDDAERARLEDLVRMFLVDRKWEGTAGFVLTDEVRVLISAMACLLVLGLDYEAYHLVKWIEVQPTTMRRSGVRSVGVGAVVSDTRIELIGQASYDGPVTIAWDAAAEGARHPERGHNVVYHEFAHKLDMADGLIDGTPVFADAEARQRWIDVCTAVFEALQEGRAGELLDPYARVNPGEFFAVATETFFDRPIELEAAHPDLYDVLRDFYRQDPAARVRRRGMTP